jgi:hypothetical protein
MGHGPHLVELLQGEGQSYQPYQNRKHDYGYPHVVEEHYIQHHQGVEHGADDDLIPK